MRFPLSLLGAFAVTAIAFSADPPKFDFPDPLVMKDGAKVTSADDWAKKRKPELKELFQSDMYGIYPFTKSQPIAKVLFEDDKAFGGKGTLKEVELRLFADDKAPPVHLLIALPNDRPKAGAPVFVGLNFSGNHSLTDDPRVHIPTGWMYPNRVGVKDNKATAEGRGTAKSVWPLEDIVKAGYAVVTCYNGDFQEDRVGGSGLLHWASPPPPGFPSPNQTATIMLWAWGVHRMVDFAVGEKWCDPKRVAVVGHSRLGKTALLAGAFDDRIACVFPHQAGCGGTGPSRHADPKAESVKRINTSFPHWFSDSFKKYNDDPNKLPIDQHELLALCAPRPVLYTNAADDLWANPSGQFDMMRRATPVYELLGVKGVEADTMPGQGKLLNSRLGYWIRAGKHEMNAEDWKTFLAFANQWMK
ncbi:MAG: acetylxylan esterase [Fimbriiglobus sp.]|jgi:hypothetical protein|nr:acetylxylan esterase [Fimbriiglobus sp.]